jgi:pimeloyl-ACP methyl ester carboxylesterase
VDGIPTAYRRAGSGEPLLYLHGGELTRSWTPLHEQLAGSFDLVAPEHPGFGDTPLGKDWDEWEDWVLHYEAFLRALGLPQVHLVGNSLGAWLAAELAVFHPDRFPTVTLVVPFGVRIGVTEPFIDPFRPSDESGLAELFNGREDRYAEDLVQLGEFEDGIQRWSESATTALLMWNPRYDIKFETRLQRITAPTLVLAAQEDRVAGQAAAGRFADLVPNAKLHVVPGPDGEPSSHGLVLEQPGDVAREITDFISGGA